MERSWRLFLSFPSKIGHMGPWSSGPLRLPWSLGTRPHVGAGCARSATVSTCRRRAAGSSRRAPVRAPLRAPVQQEEIKDDTYRSVYDRGLIPIYYRVQENAGEGPLKGILKQLCTGEGERPARCPALRKELQRVAQRASVGQPSEPLLRRRLRKLD